MQSEIVRGGALRLRSEQGAFLIQRCRPGVLLVTASGIDRGQFGTAVLAELTAELERFPIDTELFVDAFGVRQVAVQTRELWTAWLERHRGRLRAVRMLVGTPVMQLVADIAGFYSRTSFVTDSTAPTFATALRASAGDSRLPDRVDIGAQEIARVEVRRKAGGVLSLADGNCGYELRTIAPNVVALRVVGVDDGTLANPVFDELRARRGPPNPLRLFIDLREATVPKASAADLWVAWFAAHRLALGPVMILSTKRAVSLIAGIVDRRSNTGDLLRQTTDAALFEASLRAYAI